MALHFRPDEMAHLLLTWYGQQGRDLPWRNSRDPYRIWLSEIMLQQTTVAAVIPYYEKFLSVFPDVKSLAAAGLEQVLELWAGLGYYSRARNLHAAAGLIVESGGEFPRTVEAWMQLPGIGRSTAGAIVSIAFDSPAPILDGNVRRVLVRLMALTAPPREHGAEKQLWNWAEALTPQHRPHDYAQAIMDLGATICLPRKPQCQLCPLQALCRAREQGLEQRLPVGHKKPAIPTRRQAVLLLEKKGRLLIRQRMPTGLLGGMWEFPCCDLAGSAEPDEALAELRKAYPVETEPTYLGRIKHLYSHFRLEADVFLGRAGGTPGCAEAVESSWQSFESLVAGPLHGAHQKALKLALKELK